MKALLIALEGTNDKKYVFGEGKMLGVKIQKK